MTISANDWGTLVGTVLPGVISIITRRHWSPRAKAITAFVVVLVATVATLVVEGQLIALPTTLEEMIQMFGRVMAATVISYHAIWKPTGAAEAVEANINGGNVPTVQVPVTTEVPADSGAVSQPTDAGTPSTDPVALDPQAQAASDAEAAQAPEAVPAVTTTPADATVTPAPVVAPTTTPVVSPVVTSSTPADAPAATPATTPVVTSAAAPGSTAAPESLS